MTILQDFLPLIFRLSSEPIFIYLSVLLTKVPYEEFIRSIPNMTILNLFDVHPMEGRIMMEVNPTIAYTMMDRVMGGLESVITRLTA